MSKRINWTLLEAHQLDYDGNCVHCGGNCRCKKARQLRENVRQEIDYIEFHEFENKGDINRHKYLKQRFSKCYTY